MQFAKLEQHIYVECDHRTIYVYIYTYIAFTLCSTFMRGSAPIMYVGNYVMEDIYPNHMQQEGE